MVPRDPGGARSSRYLAVLPPPRARRALARLMADLGTRDAAPHVTLVAPPEVPPGESWLRVVREVATATAPLLVRLGEVESFEDRVLYLAVEGDGLYRLRDELEHALGLAARVEPFVAHLTLAVARRHHPLATVGPESIPPIVRRAFVVESLALFTRRAPGAPYARERTFALAGAA